MALTCPVCSGLLVQIPLHGRVTHNCPQRHGRALSLSAVRSWLVKEARPVLDKALQQGRAGKGCPCPRCRKKMKLLRFGESTELDHCDTCGITWFDQGEYESLPRRGAEEIESGSGAAFDVQVETSLTFRAGMSPYENLRGDETRFPFVTIFLILTCTALTRMARAHELSGFVFDSARPLAGFGLPALLSVFAHVNPAHLLGNVLFFFFPGALFESAFGERALVEVFFFSAAAALVATAFFLPDAHSLGASGAIAGVFAATCFTQPHAVKVIQKHGFLLQLMSFYTITFRVPMWAVFAWWIGLQLVGAWGQLAGPGGATSYVAHLSGAAAGLLFVMGSELKVLRPAGRVGP